MQMNSYEITAFLLLIALIVGFLIESLRTFKNVGKVLRNPPTEKRKKLELAGSIIMGVLFMVSSFFLIVIILPFVFGIIVSG